MAIRMRRSSGNVFEDAGFPRPEADRLLIRSELMSELKMLITKWRLTQKQAAKALGVTQPRISDLVRGRIDLFSIDTLVDMMGQFGIAVTLKTSGSKRRPRVA